VIAPARRAAFDALLSHATRGTDLTSALTLARRGLTDPRDHTLATELVSGTVRMRRAIDYQLARHITRPLARLDIEVLTVLRLGAFQVMYLDRVPASAAVHDAVDLTRRGGKTSARGLVNAVLRSLSREADRLAWPEGDSAEALGTRLSHPDWLVRRWLSRYGVERTARWLAFNNQPPRLCLAANRARGTREDVAARLAAEGVATRPTDRAPDGLVVVEGAALTTAAFAEGWFAVQDEASQLITTLAPVGHGARVLDLCASPGGKTVALAASGACVVACDVRPRRVRLLRTTLARTGLTHVAIVQVPASGTLPFADDAFELVLVDAPCSGLGTLRRDPDIRWNREPGDLFRLAHQQGDLLRQAARLVRRGGTLLYATCSSEPEENEDVVSGFLPDHPGFTLAYEHRTLPPDDGLEAFYGAVIARNV